MKSLLILFILTIVFISGQIRSQNQTDVLFIGNSFTYYPYTYDVPTHFEGFANAEGISVYTDMVASAGASVQDNHLDDPNVLSTLQSREWDYVVIQDNLGYWAYGYIGQETGDDNVALINMVHANNTCAKVILFSGWGPEGGIQGEGTIGCIQNIYTSFLSFNSVVQEIIAPIGLAWITSLNDQPGIDLYYSDNTHSSNYGSFLTSGTIFCSIFKFDISNSAYSGGLGSADAQFLRETAYNTVIDPTNFADCNNDGTDYTPAVSFDGNDVSTPDIYSQYQWYLDGDLISGADSYSYTIGATGNYSVVTTDANGCEFWSAILYCVYDPSGAPVADFEADNTTILVNESVNFTDLSTSGTAISQWNWSFTGGNPASSALQNPTVSYNTAGTYSVSLTVTNSNGTDTETKTGYITVLSQSGAFTLDFEACSDYSSDFFPWTELDEDGLATYGSSDCDFPGEAQAMSFIAFNPDDAGFTLSGAHGGDRCGMAICPGDASQADDWLISSKITLSSGSQIAMWVKSPKPGSWGNNSYQVEVSATTNSPSAFSVISGASPIEAPSDWTQHTYDLSAFDGQEVYIAIHHVSVDKFMFFVDDISITPITDIEELSCDKINIYPNPTTGMFCIDGDNIDQVEIRDITGRIVCKYQNNFQNIDISYCKEGLYFVLVESDSGNHTFKLIKQ